MDDWNDLRLVLAIRRAGSLTAAAKALAIDHSTVFRRLNAIEARLTVRLFERLAGGTYLPTGAGARMAASGERMDDEAIALERDIMGRDHQLSGRLRVTSSETLASSRLGAHLATFRAQYPGIVIELVIDNRVLDLSRREADIALRPVRPKESDLWGRKLSDVAWALYGSHSFVEQKMAQSQGLSEMLRRDLIGWEETVSGIGAAEWLERAAPPTSFVYRSNSIVNQLHAARAGIGLALLPCYLGDSDSGVRRATPATLGDIVGELWIVTHSDLKATARVRAFFDVVGDGLARERKLFEGKPAPALR